MQSPNRRKLECLYFVSKYTSEQAILSELHRDKENKNPSRKLKAYAPNNRASEYLKQKVIEL